MAKRKTVGEQSLIARSDNTKYDPLEIAEQEVKDLNEELLDCLTRHKKLFDEDEFCIVLQRNVKDPLIEGVRRNKFYGWLWLPQPRPYQTVFYYHRPTESMKRLWTLPNPKQMAIYSELPWVHEDLGQIKIWCDAFFRHDFHEIIRKQHNINMLTQDEYLNLNREELVKAGSKYFDGTAPDAFDFSKVSGYKVVDSVDTARN